VAFADSHLHLADYQDPDAELVLAVSVKALLTAVSTDQDTSRKSLEIASKHPETVKAFVGVHPSEATKIESLTWFAGMLDEAAGCGEIGLDPKYSESGPGSRQAQVYEAMLQAAETARKPVQVHSRGAENACLQGLSRFSPKGVLLHWFEGEELREVMDRGYFISFGPALLYSKKLQRMAVSSDRSLVLTESDGPVSFGPLGGVKGPALVPSVIFKLAELWKLGVEETGDLLLENYHNYIDRGGKG